MWEGADGLSLEKEELKTETLVFEFMGGVKGVHRRGRGGWGEMAFMLHMKI